jgi:hypothetical protein
VHKRKDVVRKIILLLVAVLVPGGLIAVAGAWVAQRLFRTRWGTGLPGLPDRTDARFRSWDKPVAGAGLQLPASPASP